MRRPPRHLATAALAVVAAGCGSAEPEELPPPAQAPPPRAQAVKPDGRLVPRTARIRPRTATRIGTTTYRLDGATLTREGGPRRRLEGDPVAVSYADRGRRLAVLLGRAREVLLLDPRTLETVARAPAGVGPTDLAAEAGRLYVTDAVAGGLLVLQVDGDDLRVTRRAALPGGPFALTVDEAQHRLYVVLAADGAVVQLRAHGRPSVVRRWRTPPAPRAVRAGSGTVVVRAARGPDMLLGPDDTQDEPEG